MAFSNLFTNLSHVQGTVNVPSHRNDFNSEHDINSKRKAHTMLTGPYAKKRHLQPHAAGISDAVQSEQSKASESYRFNGANNYPRDGFHKHNQKPFSSNDHYQGNRNNTQKKKKNKGKKKRENAQRYKNPQRDERGRNQNHTQPNKPFMSQEFKEQHSLEVDGRLLCIYFLRGRCIKGEECQFQHVEGYNGLIKEACKFYIQGFCLKGKNCPYLHETFPCKFFHTKSCKRDQCLFSHDPLTDLTRKLLDDFLQRENEQLELRKKAEEEALSLTEKVPEAVEENKAVEIVIPTTMPSFYQSSAVEENVPMPDEEQPTEEDDAPQTQDDEEPEDSVPVAVEQPEPVCYSVEAMLGPKLFKPCLYTAPKSHEASQSEARTASDRPLDVDESPYSVANVLKSSSFIQTSTCGTNDKETNLILDDKYSVSPNVQENIFKKPLSFLDPTASGYYNEKSEKTSCERLKTNEKLTVESTVPNVMLEEEESSTECKRNYIPLMRNESSSRKYTPLMGSVYQPQVQKGRFGERKHLKESYFKDKAAPSVRNSDSILGKTFLTNQVTSRQQNPKEANSGKHLENAASSCSKTTRLNLTPHVDEINTEIQSVEKSESNCADQTICSSEAKVFTWNIPENTKPGCTSENKREEIERDVSLFESLPPSTVRDGFSDKPSVKSAQKHGKSICASGKISSSSNRAKKPSLLIGSTRESTIGNSKSDSSSVTVKVKCPRQEEDLETSGTSPNNSFKSIFASLSPDVNQTSTVRSRSGDTSDSPSVQKAAKSNHHSPSLESPSLQNNNNHIKKAGERTKTPSNDSQGSVTSPATSKVNFTHIKDDVVSAKTAFQSIFASLTPSSSVKSVAPSFQKPENCASNQAKNSSQTNDMASEMINHSSLSKKLVSSPVKAKIKCIKKEEDSECAKTPPAKSFQSLFTSLTPDSDQTQKEEIQSVQKDEKSIDSRKVEFDLHRARKESQNDGESTADHSNNSGLREASTENSSNNCPKFERSDLQNKKQEVDVETKETSVKSFQSLFARLTTTVNKSDGRDVLSPDGVETSTCGDSNQNTPKKSQFNQIDSSQTPTQSLETGGKCGRMETSNNNSNVIESHHERPRLPRVVDRKLPNAKRTSSQASNVENDPKKKRATDESPEVSDKTHESLQHQSNYGAPSSVLKSLFQQLGPYEQHVSVKRSIHPG